MYRIDRNNHHLNPKNSTIYTPKEVSQFIFNLLKDQLSPRHELIFDPCSGQGSLLAP
jgi:type I restriction-modification system DNA methylase subunit